VMIPLSGRVPGRASEPSQTRVDDGSGSWMEALAFRVFPRMWIYRRKSEVGGRPRGPHHGAGRPVGGPRHHQVWPPRCSTSSPLWTPRTRQQNRNFCFYFDQFREYFLQ
jgi:hypothetical protein